MAARQLPPGRGADPRDPRRPAAGLLSPAAETGRRARSPAIRACSAWPGPSSRTPTATSIPTRCAVSSPPTRRVQPLTIGELWAVAITLRIVLIENLRRLADQITAGRARAHRCARRWRTGCSPRAGARVGTRARHRVARRAGRCPSSSPRNSPSGCATRIPEPRRRWAGWRSGCGCRARPIDEVVRARAAAAGRLQRHRAQRHHQHAADLRHRLGRAVRERQPGRRAAARGQRLRGHGFPHPQPVPQRDRATGARVGAFRTGDRRPRARGVRRGRSRSGGRGAGRARRRPRLSPDRRRAARASSARSASGRRLRLAISRFNIGLGIGGYVGAILLVAAVLLALSLQAVWRAGRIAGSVALLLHWRWPRSCPRPRRRRRWSTA